MADGGGVTSVMRGRGTWPQVSFASGHELQVLARIALHCQLGVC